MIMTKYELCSILLKWLQTFNLNAPHKTIEDVCDGVAMAQALHEIAPEWFSKMWLSKIKTDVGDNWRLKVSNLKKIIEGIIDYYQEYFNQHLADSIRPDAIKIGEQSDISELAKLLQLILGCAINCNKKQEYIKNIMLLEESVQNVIMQSIQELEHSLGSTSLSFTAGNLNVDSESQIQQLITELQLSRESNEQLVQKCLDLNAQVSLLQEENSNIMKEKKYYEEQLQEILNDPIKDNVLRKQIELLKEELFKAETSRDDYRMKLEIQEKELYELQTKFDVLQQTVAEARNLKDEVDILRENADKVEHMESTIQLYKKKLEDMTELKREMKLLENKNTSYIQQIMELEEEVKKANTWKCQIEMYKKQITELRNNLNEEAKKVDKMEFENMKVLEKLNAVEKEKERITAERDSLKEMNDELICSKLQTKDNDIDMASVDKRDKDDIISEGIESKIQLKQELARLQRENNLLKNNRKDETSTAVLQEIIDDITMQNKQYQQENRLLNQRLLELEAKLKESNEKDFTDVRIKELQAQLQLERNLRISEVAEKDRMITEQKQVASIMEDTVMEKEHEIQCIEERYKKCVEKAKYIYKSLDNSQLLSSRQYMHTFPDKLLDKTSILEEIEKPYEANRLIKDADEKQLASSFYMISQKKRDLTEQKLNNSNSVAGNLPFLAKQRQSATRRVPFQTK